jgi:hypothetical protein
MGCSKLRKSLYVIAVLLVLVGLLGGCDKEPAKPPTPTEEPSKDIVPIAKLKMPEWEEFAGQEVTVEGIFVRDPVPMLVTDLDAVLVNVPIPEGKYILLAGEVAENIPAEKYGGAYLRLVGEVVAAEKAVDRAPYAALASVSYEMVAREFVPYYPELYMPYFEVDPRLLWPDKYAILFSGGYNAWNNYGRYWNDLKFMYSTLVNTLGFDPNNIAVLYADGTAKDTDMPVHYSATQANLTTAFDLLREASGSMDTVFVFFTNHGGGFYENDPDSLYNVYGGGWDADTDEPADVISEGTYGLDLNSDGDTNDQVGWDEVLYSWGGSILDDAFHTIISDLSYNEMVIVMEQCFSGGLIHDLVQGGGDRIIMSAAGEYEPSWAMGPTYTYDEFSYYFTCAINGADPNGNAVNADANGNGRVSMVEAFNYARTQDTRSETPWYEDNGDGTPHSGNMPSGGDGVRGNTTFLD